jgi:hypothetical protein
MTLAVLIREELGDVRQIELDIDPKKNEIFLLLSGSATFIGQWPDLDVVIMKPQYGSSLNNNKLPPPFDTEEVRGSILLVRMDEESEPQDFTLAEYLSFFGGDKSVMV